MESNRRDGFVFRQPRTLGQRQDLARVLVERLGYRIPVALDPIEGPGERAYAAWPERLYIIATSGRVHYQGGLGPFDFEPAEAGEALSRLLVGTPRRTKQ